VSVRREERPDILSGTQISVNFRGLKALQSVDIGVPEGGIVGLVGPNGAGKSTLLGVLSGDVRAQQGVVRLGGKDVSGLAPETRVRRGLARTFQLPQLFDELTVREHLTLPRRLAQAPSREWSDPLTGRFLHRDAAEEQEVDALLASLGLESVADTLAGVLPLGLTRLVEIARAAATHPAVILLDEPFSGLNPAESRRLSRTLASLNQAEGIAMVLVEHDVEVVFDLSERVFVLDFGELIAAGTPAEIRRHPAVRAAYLGDFDLEPTERTPAPAPSRPALTVVEPPQPSTPEAVADILEISKLSVNYADATALHEVSFAVRPRSVTALLGANGAGKSSLARAVSGLVKAQSGQIRFDGADITSAPADRIRALGIAYLPEGRGIFRSLTVEENLKVALQGMPKAERPAAIERSVALFPVLGQRRRQTAGTLSGGEQQMLSLARVLARQPRLLIADEISLGLAPLIVEEVFAGLERVIELGVSVILIEQFVHRALAIADDCHVLRRGRLVWSGEASQAGADLVEHYLGGSNETPDVTLRTR
jgi:ABC-type branched-subunit amino acid transport system ATPase component